MVEPLGDMLDRAAKLSASGRRRKAVALLRSTADSHPDSAEVWCRLAAALLDRGDATAALAAARRALPLDGDKAWVHRLVAKALSRLSRHAEAVSAAKQAVRAAPADWRCRIALAEAFGAAGSWPDAVDAAAQAVRYQPDHVRPYLVLGDAARRTGDLVTAERAYRTALRRKPGDPRVRAELARLRPATSSRPAASGSPFAPGRFDARQHFDENEHFDENPDVDQTSASVDGGRPHPGATRADRPWSPSRWQSHRPPRHADWSADSDWPTNSSWSVNAGRSTDSSWSVGSGRSTDSRRSADPGRSTDSHVPRVGFDRWTGLSHPSIRHPVPDRRVVTERAPGDTDRSRRAGNGRDPGRRTGAGRRTVRRRADAGRDSDVPSHAHRDLRRADDRQSPVAESLAWRGVRQLAVTVVIAGTFLMVAGLPKPTPVLAWLGFAIPGVVVVVAFAELVRAPSGSRLAVLTMPLRRPAVGLSCVLLALSNALVLLWAMLDRANAGTMEPLVFALVCAVCAGVLSLVNEA